MKLETIFRVSAPLRAAPLALRYLMATAIILISALFDRGPGMFAVLLSAGPAWFYAPRASGRSSCRT